MPDEHRLRNPGFFTGVLRPRERIVTERAVTERIVTERPSLPPRGPMRALHPGGMTTIAPEATVLLESCTSTWIFDTQRMRFRRVVKGLGLTSRDAITAWRPYYALEIDGASESFTVALNPERTRRIQSWRHLTTCLECGGGTQSALDPEELKSAVLG